MCKSKEDVFSEIKEKIQEILNEAHKHPAKRRIKTTSSGLEIACPICGDSQKNPYKKRGKLWWSNMYYVCYNEGCNRKLSRLLSNFNQTLSIDTTLALKDIEDEYRERVIKTEDIEGILAYMDRKITIPELLAYYNQENTELYLKTITKSSIQYTYLVSRGVKFKDDIPNHIMGGRLGKTTVIAFLNMIGDNVLSIQLRSIDPNKRRIFKYYTFSKLHSEVKGEELEPKEGCIYDAISPYFGLFKCDVNKPIYVFEGQINSMFIPNSISLVGVNTDISFLIDQGMDIRLMFDNDDVGINKSIKYARIYNKLKIFKWKQFLEDMGLPKVNDIGDIAKHNASVLNHITSYFTIDALDIHLV